MKGTDVTILLDWLVRYGHVLGATLWVGGYAVLAFLIVPRIAQGTGEAFVHLAIATVRMLTYTGTLTMGFGLILITRTNGFSNLFGSTWGSFIIAGSVIAIVLLGIGDGALRPAILSIGKTGDAPARCFALIGFVLAVLAVGVMTGAMFIG
ncbi:hypothetical protein [Ktedonospora formicarum]|uniref:Copper resistance protein D domain-containing protein n=1 Tax=Ktedonospora formicarum TaxID=2778364 RepID=A0A8J3I8D1_9CHLR|nr:hypothetical protein [Ktedonospora formicarum]GHO50511.1 hypothetical protein KSX_86740 [Ktedonospora formicarum]